MTISPAAKQVAADLRQIGDYLNARFFEREDAVEALLLGALTKLHILLSGTPGTAKSNIAEVFTSCLGGEYFWQQMDLLLTKEDFKGPLDMKRYEESGRWEHDVDGYLPTADVAVFDEVGKTGPAVLTMLLTYLNERTFKNGKNTFTAPLLFAVGTTNEVLDDPSGAMRDRFTLGVEVADFTERRNFLRMMRGEGRELPKPTTDIDMVRKVADVEVPTVYLPDAILETVADLREAMRREHEIQPSPRRFWQGHLLLKASALLNDRDTVNEDDLAVLRHVLWERPEQITGVTNTVLSHSSPAIQALIEQSGVLDDIQLGWAEREKEPTPVKALYAGEVSTKLASVKRELSAAKSDSPRVMARIDEVKDRWIQLRALTLSVGMGMDPTRAAKNAAEEIS